MQLCNMQKLLFSFRYVLLCVVEYLLLNTLTVHGVHLLVHIIA